METEMPGVVLVFRNNSAGTDSAVNLWMASPPSSDDLSSESLMESHTRSVDPLLNSYSDYEGGVYGRPIIVDFSPVTDFREATCRQYEENACNCGGYCNFMHLKRIGRELRRQLFERYCSRHSRSRSRSRSPYRHRSYDGALMEVVGTIEGMMARITTMRVVAREFSSCCVRDLRNVSNLSEEFPLKF
ncbi:Splicing factor U2af small subunit A [Camellia lanceoleosa]|uniref:Splicing factor U2af small subunit A n=1 Tax=Camellia lanceoleosa TaxID=1840588 RepID=A0ACC0G9K1_9ERIC|nr:Splicing factor U2af small subunit A [Camellia lanceoleosa]